MSISQPSELSIKRDGFLLAGRTLLAGALSGGLLFILLLAWRGADLLPFVPVALVACVGVWHLYRRPVLNLYVALAGFVVITGYDEGYNVEEILYGLYFLGFLAYWFTSRTFFYRDRFVQSPVDVALLVFLVYMVASTTWSVALFNTHPRNVIGELMVLVMLAFYFPIREVCATNPRHVKRILLITVWFALFVFVRNVITYWTGLAAATQLWQIVAGRIVLNEVLLMMPALGALVLVVYDERSRQRVVWGLLFALFTTGLILTRSRGYWVAFAFGVAVLFVLVDRKRKMRIVSVAAIVGGSVLVVGLLFLQELTTLVLAGLVDRVTSLGSALTSDISLVNRFHESKEVWEHIRANPVVGYGIGARYRVYDLIDDVTMTKPFIHNGFIGMWFKYGLIGLGCLLTYWAGVIRTGLRVYRSVDSPQLLRLAGLMAALAMIAEIVVANTSTPFQIADATLMFAICGGVASGAADYLKNRPSPE